MFVPMHKYCSIVWYVLNSVYIVFCWSLPVVYNPLCDYNRVYLLFLLLMDLIISSLAVSVGQPWTLFTFPCARVYPHDTLGALGMSGSEGMSIPSSV